MKYFFLGLLLWSCSTLDDKSKAHKKLADGYRLAAAGYVYYREEAATPVRGMWQVYTTKKFASDIDSLKHDSLFNLAHKHELIADSLHIEYLKTKL